MLRFEKPEYKITEYIESNHYGKFELEPLERGFGTTMGNALRRVMLSSLPGSAITSVKIEGVMHEFQKIDGIVEDVTAIILALKSIVIKNHTEEDKIIRLSADKEGTVTAGDIEEEHMTVRKKIQEARLKRIQEEIFGATSAPATPTTLNIVSVDPCADVSAAIGSSVSSLALPTTVDVLLSDSSVKSLAVTWNLSTVSLGAAGSYIAKGDLTLVSGVTNTSSLQAKVTVVVL